MPANQTSLAPKDGASSGLSVPSGSAFPSYAEIHKALDELHAMCECATVPEVEAWYRGEVGTFGKNDAMNLTETLVELGLDVE